jgi:hypothetical protein
VRREARREASRNRRRPEIVLVREYDPVAVDIGIAHEASLDRAGVARREAQRGDGEHNEGAVFHRGPFLCVDAGEINGRILVERAGHFKLKAPHEVR